VKHEFKARVVVPGEPDVAFWFNAFGEGASAERHDTATILECRITLHGYQDALSAEEEGRSAVLNALARAPERPESFLIVCERSWEEPWWRA